jgi:hypothetical protein
MARTPWRNRLDRAVKACAIVGALLLLICVTSLFCAIIYQQPPGAWMPPPGTPTGVPISIPPGTPPAGNVRVRFLAGSLIICDGDLRPTTFGKVKSTLGHMFNSGVTWLFNTPPRAWPILADATTWRYYFFREQVQIQFFPIALALLAPWSLRRWVFKPKPA